MLADLPGFIFRLEIQRNDCACTFCEGELLGRLGLFSKDMLSNQARIFKILGPSMEDYCFSNGTTKDQKVFTINYKDTMLLVSLKRNPSSEGVRSIVGSVVELIDGQQKKVKAMRSDKISQFHYEQAKNLSEI